MASDRIGGAELRILGCEGKDLAANRARTAFFGVASRVCSEEFGQLRREIEFAWKALEAVAGWAMPFVRAKRLDSWEHLIAKERRFTRREEAWESAFDGLPCVERMWTPRAQYRADEVGEVVFAESSFDVVAVPNPVVVERDRRFAYVAEERMADGLDMEFLQWKLATMREEPVLNPRIDPEKIEPALDRMANTISAFCERVMLQDRWSRERILAAALWWDGAIPDRDGVEWDVMPTWVPAGSAAEEKPPDYIPALMTRAEWYRLLAEYAERREAGVRDVGATEAPEFPEGWEQMLEALARHQIAGASLRAITEAMGIARKETVKRMIERAKEIVGFAEIRPWQIGGRPRGSKTGTK